MVASEHRNTEEDEKIFQEYQYSQKGYSRPFLQSQNQFTQPQFQSNKSYPYTELSSNWGIGCNKSENQQDRL